MLLLLLLLQLMLLQLPQCSLLLQLPQCSQPHSFIWNQTLDWILLHSVVYITSLHSLCSTIGDTIYQ